MQPHQERVVSEREELQTKAKRLAEFLRGSVFPTLPLAEQDRLVQQLEHMNAYRRILDERIAAFDPVV